VAKGYTYNTEYGKFSYMVTWLAHNKIDRKASRDRQKTEGGKKILSYGTAVTQANIKAILFAK